jgi:hypothetical protein
MAEIEAMVLITISEPVRPTRSRAIREFCLATVGIKVGEIVFTKSRVIPIIANIAATPMAEPNSYMNKYVKYADVIAHESNTSVQNPLAREIFIMQP